MNKLKQDVFLLKQAIKQPDVFGLSREQFNDEKKHWIENITTFRQLGKKYGFDLYDIQKNIPLKELNQHETGDTILWDAEKEEYVIGQRAKDIYYPRIVTGCRAYLNHRQIIEERVRTKIELDVCSYGSDMFDRDDHSIIVPESAPRYLIIGGVWYDFGAVDKGVYSVVVAKNGKPLSKDALIERDDMCASSEGKDIMPHGMDVWPLEKGDKISLWTVFYKGGPCELKTAHTQNYLTVIKL